MLMATGIVAVNFAGPVGVARAEDDSGENGMFVAGVEALAGIEVVEAVLVSTELPAVRDSYTASNRPDTNYGNDENLAVGYQLSDGDPGALRSFIQFDFPGGIPAGSTINQARVRLYQRSATGIGDMRIVINRPSGSWDESSITWGNQPGFAGGERASEFIDSSTGHKEWNITGLAQEWKSGAVPNHGIIVEGLEEIEDNRRLFYSRNAGDASLRPVLIVDYTPPGGSAPPSSSFVHPANPYQNTADFLVEWRADDPSGTGIAYFDVQFRQPGQAWQDWQVRTAATSATFVGEHGRTYEFRVRAVNLAGVAEPFSETADTSTRLDLVAPVVTVNQLPTFTNQSPIQVTWSGFDDVSGVRNYDVQIRYGNEAWVDAIIGTQQTSYSLPGREGVAAQVRVRAGDNAGNLSDYNAAGASTSTTLDTVAPRACVFRIIPGYQSSLTPFSVSWQGSDGAGSGVAAYDIEYRHNGGAWLALETNVGFTGATFTPQLGPGLYEFRARARDVVGNQGQFHMDGRADAAIMVAQSLPSPDMFLPLIGIASETDAFLAQCNRE